MCARGHEAPIGVTNVSGGQVLRVGSSGGSRHGWTPACRARSRARPSSTVARAIASSAAIGWRSRSASRASSVSSSIWSITASQDVDGRAVGLRRTESAEVGKGGAADRRDTRERARRTRRIAGCRRHMHTSGALVPVPADATGLAHEVGVREAISPTARGERHAGRGDDEQSDRASHHDQAARMHPARPIFAARFVARSA